MRKFVAVGIFIATTSKMAKGKKRLEGWKDEPQMFIAPLVPKSNKSQTLEFLFYETIFFCIRSF